ncbi:YutD family protein [Brevibacillus fulvus]|uniref:Uncharacterized protein YutD n=1 Tax=Brevibacillus fulvus TaxID=1125967 RepID=A0A938Y490_9BACL|nr:YutD family protein [Brevibacillus fulvus]MBM7592034.1 uncharacterized protein YutD [Brevibacillus fulvus]
MIRLQAGTYELMEESRNGWNLEAFKERYSDILDKYDYIVGDWGYGQLRLRGFYENTNRKVLFEQRIAALDEYLHEFCNFGCPYFVLKKVKATAADGDQELSRDDEFVPVEQTVQFERKQRNFMPRHSRNERQERSGNGEKQGRPERAKNNRQEAGERNNRERRGGYRPVRDKVPANSTNHSKKPEKDI